MPVNPLMAAQQAKADRAKNGDAKYFDRHLTGTGGTVGLMQASLDPINDTKTAPDDYFDVSQHRTVRSGDSLQVDIPVSVLSSELRGTRMKAHLLENPDDMVRVPELDYAQWEAWIDVFPTELSYTETKVDPKQPPKRLLNAMWNVVVCYLGSQPTRRVVPIIGPSSSSSRNGKINLRGAMVSNPATMAGTGEWSVVATTRNPLVTIAGIGLPAYAPGTVGMDVARRVLQNVSFARSVMRQSLHWKSDVRDIVLTALDNLFVHSSRNSAWGWNATCHDIIGRLASYDVAIEDYSAIYHRLEKVCSHHELQGIIRDNLSMMLAQTLSELAAEKPSLQALPAPSPNPAVDPRLTREQQAAVTTTKPLVLVNAAAGTGKAQPLNEPVLTPEGWRAMGDLEVGDLVIGADGAPHRLTRIHDRGILPCYSLTFRDGSSTRVAPDHLWTVAYDEGGRHVTRTLTTQEWLDDPQRGRYAVPTVEPVRFPHADIDKDPYELGIALSCAGADPHDVGVGLSNSAGARIGHELLFSDVEQRTALVHGIFDAGGSIRRSRGQATYATRSKGFSDDLLQLLWSLGVSAKREYSSRRKAWVVTVIDADAHPFTEASGLDLDGVACDSTMRRTLAHVERMGDIPMRCIEVDSPDHLYVTKDFIVTHNSSTIKHRLAYMRACGVDMGDVTTLSFTNAAADHLAELVPGVHSMTIAKMIHTVYEYNYPNQQLAEAKTLANAIAIWFPHDDFTNDLRRCITDVSKSPDAMSWTNLNNFVQDNFDKVVSVLASVGMTTLELEIVICYQRIDQMREPAEIASRYLVLDEVQDNSLFEFVYVLRYVAKNKESLYIVGDPSQTLYEFRNSNPEVLNALQRTGVFDAYSLQVNFRSNQAILDYANTLLADVRANDAAGLRLVANSITPVTKADFEDKVKVAYTKTTVRGWSNDLLSQAMFSDVTHDFIKDALASHRQVALIAHTRALASRMEECASSQFKSATVLNICPQRVWAFDAFSRFCVRYWDEIKFSQHPFWDVRSCVTNHLDDLVYNVSKSGPIVRSALDEWESRTAAAYNGWATQEAAGRFTHDQVLDAIKASLLSFENHLNAINQHLVGSRNEELKKQNDMANANIIVSTIHSVKGLEFDDVVIDYADDSRMDEADKRMYYVALTRAKCHELVLAHGTLVMPPCETRWLECRDSYPV